MTTPSRTLATFKVLWDRYGEPTGIRVGYVDHTKGPCAFWEFLHDGVYDRACHDAYVDPCRRGSFYQYRGAEVRIDGSLAPWEVAWDGKVEPRETFHEAMHRIRIEYPDMITDTCP